MSDFLHSGWSIFIAAVTIVGLIACLVLLLIALFSVLFGTRHIDAAERHEGMVAAIAFESVVKLAAYLAVGVFVSSIAHTSTQSVFVTVFFIMPSFVLSGFIVLHAHAPDVGRPAALGRYLWRRFARVYPVYWLYLGVYLALLALAGHYRFEPRPVAVARGNEKGRVERAIRYVRDSFFAAAANAIHRVLVDHARRRARDKRGGSALSILTVDSRVPDAVLAKVATEIDATMMKAIEVVEL